MQPGEVLLETTVAKVNQMPGNMPYEQATHLLHMYQRAKADRYV